MKLKDLKPRQIFAITVFIVYFFGIKPYQDLDPNSPLNRAKKRQAEVHLMMMKEHLGMNQKFTNDIFQVLKNFQMYYVRRQSKPAAKKASARSIVTAEYVEKKKKWFRWGDSPRFKLIRHERVFESSPDGIQFFGLAEGDYFSLHGKSYLIKKIENEATNELRTYRSIASCGNNLSDQCLDDIKSHPERKKYLLEAAYESSPEECVKLIKQTKVLNSKVICQD